MIYGDRLSTDDTVRNATVCGGTVGNAYAHRLAHLFSLSIATYPPFHLVSCCVPVRQGKSQPSRTDSYASMEWPLSAVLLYVIRYFSPTNHQPRQNQEAVALPSTQSHGRGTCDQVSNSSVRVVLSAWC